MDVVKKIKPEINRVGSPDDLANRAFDIFFESSEKAISSMGCFNVAISGGHTPEGFFELLAEGPKAKSIQWDKIQLFWVDERCVPPDADASNYGLAAHTFLDKVDIPSQNVHRMPGEVEDYEEAIKEYDGVIREVFNLRPGQMPSFDLVVLGMGSDGHIGSLFPNSYALFDTDDLVSVVYLMDGKYSRITLTHPVLCAAQRLVILVSGSEKASILKTVLDSEPDSIKYPVHTLWPILRKVTWVVDSEAGKEL
jgi:6-phosphogluconolactonase